MKTIPTHLRTLLATFLILTSGSALANRDSHVFLVARVLYYMDDCKQLSTVLDQSCEAFLVSDYGSFYGTVISANDNKSQKVKEGFMVAGLCSIDSLKSGKPKCLNFFDMDDLPHPSNEKVFNRSYLPDNPITKLLDEVPAATYVRRGRVVDVGGCTSGGFFSEDKCRIRIRIGGKNYLIEVSKLPVAKEYLTITCRMNVATMREECM